VGLLERLGEMAKAALTTDTELKNQREMMGDIRISVQRLEGDVGDLRARVARLETLREADRAQMSAELARFKAEVERAELRLARRLPPNTEPGSGL